MGKGAEKGRQRLQRGPVSARPPAPWPPFEPPPGTTSSPPNLPRCAGHLILHRRLLFRRPPNPVCWQVIGLVDLDKDALRRQGTSSSSTACTGSSRDAPVLDAAQALRAAKRRQGEMGPKFEPTCRADCWSRCRSGAPSSRANACPTPPLHARARRIRSLHICACRDVPCTYVAAVSVDERRTGGPGLCGMEPGLLLVSVGQTRPTETPIHPAKGRK